jgi:hypothetical protein
MITKDEYIKNRKGAVMTYSKVLPQPPPGEIEENLEKTSVIPFSMPAEIQTVYLQNLLSRTVLPVLKVLQPLLSSRNFFSLSNAPVVCCSLHCK